MKKGWFCRGNPCRGKVLHPAWKRAGSLGEFLARERQYIHHEKWMDLLMNTYLEARPTTNMKKGWLCRTSYDEKNWEITLFDRDSRSSDFDDDLVMIQHWWWSSDDLVSMMIEWWSSFDDDPMMIQLWWWSSDDDLVTMTCDDELCQENTFLVKRSVDVFVTS